MDKIRVSKSIMDSLNATGKAIGNKYIYTVKERLSPNCIVVERYPRYFIHRGVDEGRRWTSYNEAKWNGWIETVQVKGV